MAKYILTGRPRGVQPAPKEDIKFIKAFFDKYEIINRVQLCKRLSIPYGSIYLICNKETPHVANKHVQKLKQHIEKNYANFKNDFQ
jgi:hypothetical protein